MPRISTCRSARWRLVGGPQSLAWCMSRRCFEGMLAIILKSGRTSWRFGKRTSSCPCGKPRRQSNWASLEGKKKPKDQNPRDPHSPQNDSNREHWNHQADLAPLATLSAFLDIPSCLKNLPQSRVWEWNSHWQKPQGLEFGRRVGEEPYLHGSLLWKNHESQCRHLSSHAPLKMATQKCIMGVELPEAERTLDLEGLHKMAINTHKHTNTHTHSQNHLFEKWCTSKRACWFLCICRLHLQAWSWTGLDALQVDVGRSLCKKKWIWFSVSDLPRAHMATPMALKPSSYPSSKAN